MMITMMAIMDMIMIIGMVMTEVTTISMITDD
jgi:hypothetical protein